MMFTRRLQNMFSNYYKMRFPAARWDDASYLATSMFSKNSWEWAFAGTPLYIERKNKIRIL